ncbi:TPA: dTDP-4-dehydrorhamnose 3,5-epimerase, partial [Enterobacter asburiae]|nr:dTDP-4-dehydrorhamnose 3,5-epimerase [Enterobacter asburiae]
KVFGDERGFFYETYHEQRYKNAGIKESFVQDNRSRSTGNVLRGLHFQKRKPQGKLVTVTAGTVFDVAVDLREDSPTFGQYESIILSGDNRLQFYIPPGFAHGFCVLSDIADFQYKCTDFYDPTDEGGIIWNDNSININWPISEPNLSLKDKELPSLEDVRKQLKFGK